MFTEPSGLDSLVKEKEEEEKRKEEKRLQEKKKKSDPTESAALAQFEKVGITWCVQYALVIRLLEPLIDLLKLEEFADGNLDFYENGRKLSKG